MNTEHEKTTCPCATRRDEEKKAAGCACDGCACDACPCGDDCPCEPCDC